MAEPAPYGSAGERYAADALPVKEAIIMRPQRSRAVRREARLASRRPARHPLASSAVHLADMSAALAR
jgi:hypothetical protein